MRFSSSAGGNQSLLCPFVARISPVPPPKLRWAFWEMDFGTCSSGAALLSSASHSPLRVSAGAIPRFCRTPHRTCVRAVAEAQKLQTGSFSSDIRPAESGRQTCVHAAAGQLSHDAANSPAGSQDRAFVRVDAVDGSQNGLRLRAAAYAVNCSLLGVVAAACWAPDALHLEGLRSAYQSAMAVNPVALMVRNRPIKLNVSLNCSPRHAFWILVADPPAQLQRMVQPISIHDFVEQHHLRSASNRQECVAGGNQRYSVWSWRYYSTGRHACPSVTLRSLCLDMLPRPVPLHTIIRNCIKRH